jgi:hypothetical protein
VTDPTLVAIARALIAHCPHGLGLSERWARDASASWRIAPEPCQDCRALAAALGIEVESSSAASSGASSKG